MKKAGFNFGLCQHHNIVTTKLSGFVTETKAGKNVFGELYQKLLIKSKFTKRTFVNVFFSIFTLMLLWKKYPKYEKNWKTMSDADFGDWCEIWIEDESLVIYENEIKNMFYTIFGDHLNDSHPTVKHYVDMVKKVQDQTSKQSSKTICKFMLDFLEPIEHLTFK